MFLENSCTFYDRQIMLLSIVLLIIFWAQNVPAVRHIKSTPLRYMTNGNKNEKTKFYRILTPWFEFNEVKDTPLQQFLLSSLYSFDSQFWLISCIIVLKEFASIFKKETGKRHFLTFPDNGCKKGKKCFINNKNLTCRFELPLKKLSWLDGY